MPNPRPTHAWKISEVQRLVELPRRDIQRACYEGQGGVGILSPTDSTWGRRTYGCEDLAKLLVASELRREGLSLPEVRREFDRAAERGQGLTGMLGDWVHRLREQEEALRGRLLKAEALWAKLASGETEEDDPHEGEEFGYVLSGSIFLVMGEKKIRVKTGCSFCIHPRVTHYLMNAGKTRARVLWISTPPSF